MEENLRGMRKKTIKVLKHRDNIEYIYQIMKECDKNHKGDAVGESNEARIYANQGKN